MSRRERRLARAAGGTFQCMNDVPRNRRHSEPGLDVSRCVQASQLSLSHMPWLFNQSEDPYMHASDNARHAAAVQQDSFIIEAVLILEWIGTERTSARRSPHHRRTRLGLSATLRTDSVDLTQRGSWPHRPHPITRWQDVIPPKGHAQLAQYSAGNC